MSRSGYCEDIGDVENYGLYRATVARAIRGKRGQAFLREMAAALDAMPEKKLIANALVEDGTNGYECCAIGAVCLARGTDVSKVNYEDPEEVAKAVGISRSLAAEIEWENDEGFESYKEDAPQKRWRYMRKWVESNLNPQVTR